LENNCREKLAASEKKKTRVNFILKNVEAISNYRKKSTQVAPSSGAHKKMEGFEFHVEEAQPNGAACESFFVLPC
jgi:hypothetical protein